MRSDTSELVLFWKLSNVVSKDTSFEGSGIGKQSQINYAANFDQIKRFLVTAKFKQPGYHQRLMEEWDQEVFSKQLKKSGNHPNTEYIDVDEDPDTQINREMERLAIAESQLASDGSILILCLVIFHLITSHQMLISRVLTLLRLIAMQTSTPTTVSHPPTSLLIQFWKLPPRYVFVGSINCY